MTTSLFKIGNLAKRANISVEAIRYYESKALLTSLRCPNSGYRLYNHQQEQQLYFILHAKKIGFSLNEIGYLLGLQQNKENTSCETVKSYTGVKISEVDAKIADLQKMKIALESLYQTCCGGVESASHCSILQSLEDPKFFQSQSED